MTKPVEVTLKPCPFCGHDDPLLVTHSSDAGNEYSIRCYNGCCEVGDEHKTEAITAWNTRHEASRLRAGYSDLAFIFKRAGMTDAYNTVVNLMQHRGIALQESGDDA